MAAILSNSDTAMVDLLRAIDPEATDSEVKEGMKGKSVFIKKSTVRSGLDVVGISIDSVDSSEADTASRCADHATNLRGFTSSTSLSSSVLNRLPWSKGYIITITLLHIALFGVVLSFGLTGNDIYQVNLSFQ